MIHIESFKQYLIIDKGYSKNTISSYISDLLAFNDFNNDNLLKTTKSKIQKYIKYLREEEGLNNNSISRKITTIRSFYKFLVIEKQVANNPAEHISNPKKKKTIPNYLNESDLKKLLNFKLETKFDYRNKAILELMYATGARISEILNLKLENINFDDDNVIVQGKGNKERIIPITNHAKLYLNTYINQYRPMFRSKSTNYLFINNKKTNLTRNGFYKILNDIAKQTGIKNVTPHILRHTFATHLLNHGANLRIIQELLGHSDISTTEIYTHTSKEHLKDKYKDFHPHS